MFSLLLTYLILNSAYQTKGLCGDSIRWSHRVNMDEVYGVWYGVGYAQHNPDMTNMPNEVGCVTLYISDASSEYKDNWIDWSIWRKNFSDQNWRSSKSNPWSPNAMAGPWLDVRLKRKVKRNIEDEKRVRILWDEDGHTLEQVYLYYPVEPGLWTADKLRPLEKEMMSRGIDVWYPDDPPRHPDVIRLIKVTPHTLIINHCSEIGNGGIFSLILRRSPSKVQRWEWYKYQKEFYKFELPNIYRYASICSACIRITSTVVLYTCFFANVLINAFLNNKFVTLQVRQELHYD
ncbi:uncharacterized protein LOC113392605 [Vanessa tameamea]|uniref:Uncharacterized protein LOC113392605 n=1 Tax=Vanessa tameamea TaxID=334116 RepID=A0ABM4B006_VANTA